MKAQGPGDRAPRVSLARRQHAQAVHSSGLREPLRAHLRERLWRGLLTLGLVGWVGLTGSAACAGPAGTPPETCPAPPHRAIFYQPWNVHQALSPAHFARMGAELKRQGVDELIVQWTQYGSSDFWTTPRPWLARMLRASHQGLVLGLYADPDYFKWLDLPDAQLAHRLTLLRAKSLRLAQRILEQPPPNLRAWYLPEEIDDLHWRTPERQRLLAEHLQILSHKLHRLRPGLKVYISSFSGGHGSPQDQADLLKRLNASTGLIWLIQDGLGLRRSQAIDTAAELRLLSQALPPTAWRGVLELFDEQEEQPAQRFCPASSLEIQRRLALWCQATGRQPEAWFSLNQAQHHVLTAEPAACQPGVAPPPEPRAQ